LISFYPDKPLLRAGNEFIGSLSLFNHLSAAGHEDMDMAHQTNVPGKMIISQSFDISKALSFTDNIDNLKLVVVPFSLLTSIDGNVPVFNKFPLKINGVEILTLR
jgi:hypothetical protein